MNDGKVVVSKFFLSSFYVFLGLEGLSTREIGVVKFAFTVFLCITLLAHFSWDPCKISLFIDDILCDQSQDVVIIKCRP